MHFEVNATCNIEPETAELRIWMTLKEVRQRRRLGLLHVKSRTFKCKGERNDQKLHYEQVFGNVFGRRESKCRAVLMKHRRKVKGEQVIILQMDQKLKTKNISDVSGQLFCCQLSNTTEKAPINWNFTCYFTSIYQNFQEQYFRSIKSTS